MSFATEQIERIETLLAEKTPPRAEPSSMPWEVSRSGCDTLTNGVFSEKFAGRYVQSLAETIIQ